MLNKALRGAITATVLALGVAFNANAFVVDSTTAIDTEFKIFYQLNSGDTDPNGNTNVTGQTISGNVVMVLKAFDTTTDLIQFLVTTSNTSADTGLHVGFQKLAFGINPDATGVTFTDAADAGFISAQIGADPEVENAVGGLTLDIQTETGVGAPKTLNAGETDTFTLDISFADLTNAGATFDPFSSKWQTGAGSYEFPGTPTDPGPDPDPDPDPMPVPGTLLLLGLGLFGLRWTRRKGA